LNNCNARHFYYLSAAKPWSLRLAFKYLFSLTLTPFIFAGTIEAAEAFDVTQANIETFVTESIYSSFAETEKSDIEYKMKLPPADTMDIDCPAPITYEWRSQPEAGNNTLVIQCQQRAWKAYVPVQVEIYQMVVVAAAPLSRNHPIMSSDLSLSRLPTSRLRSGYFNKPEDVEGYEVQRTVKVGQVITPYMAKPPALVKRGDWVTIVSGSSGLKVTSTGEAMRDGSLGEQIPVKNIKTNAKIKAWVVSKGTVSTRR
jgi:flagella basal body P-ring formation protein FlgA